MRKMQNSESSNAQLTDGIEFIGNETDFLCPVCTDSSLVVSSLNGMQVCGCKTCKGFLVDSVSFGALVTTLRVEYRGAEDIVLMNSRELDKVINCPTCFNPMYTHPYHGPGNVVVNSCSECQLNWLDEGELAKIIRAPGKRGF